jgi:hypothetical protein
MTRICKRSPNLCNIESIDTLYQIKEHREIDTLFVSGEIDTFYINTDKVKTRIIRHYDTLKITQTVTPDTITTIRTIKSYTVKKPKNRYVTGIIIVNLLILVIILLWKIRS